MGQQQLLLIILGVIIVGVAIAVGISQFGTNAQNSAHDAIAGDLSNLQADAFQYKIKPKNLGGGDGKFTGYVIPTGFSTNANGLYSIVGTPDSISIEFKGESKAYPGNYITQIDSFNGHTSILDVTNWKPQ